MTKLRWHRGDIKIFYLSRAHAMGDIRNILSITCARDGGHQKYFICHVRTRWGTSENIKISRANAIATTCARYDYYVRTR
jgi:hypothetical protein